MLYPTHRGARPQVVFLVLGALEAVAAPAAAQAQVELVADPLTNWSGLYGAGEVLTKGLAADVDRDGRLDLVQLTLAGGVVWSSSPAERQHRRAVVVEGLAVSAVDVARLRSNAGDALLTASSNSVHGVRRLAFNSATGQFTKTILRTHGSGFQSVACAGRVTGPYRVAYAIAGDGLTVYPMFFYAASGQEVFPLGAFSIGTPVGTIEAFDLQGDGIAELAVVTEDHLTVRSYNGATIATYERTSTQSPSLDRLAVLQDDGSAADRLAWVTYVGSQTQVQVLSSAGLAPALAVTTMGTAMALQAASGDFDGDGLADLVLAPDEGPRVHWLRSIHSGTPRFSVAEPNDGETLGTVLAAQDLLSNAALGVGDFDRDGDTDVALSAKKVSGGSTTLNVFREESIDHARQHPTVHGASAAVSLGGGAYRLYIVLNEPLEAPAANLLRWRVWQDKVGPLRTSQDAPIVANESTLPSIWPHLVVFDLNAQSIEEASWTVAFELVDTQGSVPVIHPSLLAFGTAGYFDVITDASLPGNDLWGTILLGFGLPTPGSGGTGHVPRVPPPPPVNPAPPPEPVP